MSYEMKRQYSQDGGYCIAATKGAPHQQGEVDCVSIMAHEGPCPLRAAPQGFVVGLFLTIPDAELLIARLQEAIQKLKESRS